MSDELRSVFENPPPDPDWSDREAVVEASVRGWRPYAGTRSFDEARLREIAGRAFDRSTNIESSMKNHWLISGGEPVKGRLGDVNVPTLVLHGTEDPLFPYAHAEALADEIPGARLLPLPGMGHEMPPRPVWDQVAGAILEHTAER
jgi:pimeloyl-ACP methyl ester carboxylesterase